MSVSKYLILFALFLWTTHICFAEQDDKLEIHYPGLSFTKPQKIRFRYKSEGFDKDRVDADTRRVAIFPHLPPGNYKFRVISISSNGMVSDAAETIEISVSAPVWQRWWFFLLLTLIIIGLIIYGYQYRLRRLEKNRLAQKEFARLLINAHESERQRIAGELHDGIGQDLLIIKNWALFGLEKAKGNKQVTKQFEEISATATHAIEEARNIARNLRPNHLQRFGITEALKYTLRQIESSSSINFVADFDNIDNIFSSQAELSIFRIFQECLNNIIKHAEAENVEIRLKLSGKTLIFTIKDDGKGFDTVLFERSEKAGKAFGLINISERVKLLDGSYSLQSAQGKGTKISIWLPVKNES